MVFISQPIKPDQQGLISAIAIVASITLACWQSVEWYIQRVLFSVEEAVSVFITLGLLIYLGAYRYLHYKKLYQLPLLSLAVGLVIYAMATIFLPDIFSAFVAFTLIGFSIFWLSYGRLPVISFWGLMGLSLPVVPSLQFYLGYPARLLSASFTVPLLQLNGYSVQQQGTYLVWQDQLLQFDAPCSGVTMLWAGMLLVMLISFWHQFNPIKTLMISVIAFVAILFGNVIRAASLFYLELESVQPSLPDNVPSETLHEMVGLVVFLLIAFSLLFIAQRIKHLSWRCS